MAGAPATSVFLFGEPLVCGAFHGGMMLTEICTSSLPPLTPRISPGGVVGLRPDVPGAVCGVSRSISIPTMESLACLRTPPTLILCTICYRLGRATVSLSHPYIAIDCHPHYPPPS